MNQKQYADMATIMQYARAFANNVRNCMKNHDLMDQGYEFSIRIMNGRNAEDETFDDFMIVELEKSCLKVDWDEYKKSSMTQTNINGEGWRVSNDPVAKKGDLPTEVCYKKVADIGRGAEVASKPYPLDGLWISAYDYPSDVDGGF